MILNKIIFGDSTTRFELEKEMNFRAHHHLNSDDSRSKFSQNIPEPQQPEIADNDRHSEEDSCHLECFEGQSETQSKGHDEQYNYGEVDTVPSTASKVQLDDVQVHS